MLLNHIAIYTIDMIALMMLLGLLTKENLMKDHLKKSFKYGIIFSIIIILSEFGTILASLGNSDFRYIHMVFNVVGFSLTPLVPMALISIFDSKILRKFKCLFIPSLINAIAVFFSPWLKLIFYVSTNNVYERGSLFSLFVIVYVINIILLVVVVWQTSKKRYFPIRFKIIGLSLFALVGTSVQLFIPEVYSSWHCVTITLFLLYILLSEFEGSFDALTGLYNRLAFEKVSRSLENKKNYGVIAFDINNFKEVNDTFGHDYGDIVLKEIADVMKQTFDKHTSSYRIGGDEFCIIVNYEDEEVLKEKLKSMTTMLKEIREKNVHLPTLSYGYDINTKDYTRNFQKAYKEADRQMYLHKQTLKDKIK